MTRPAATREAAAVAVTGLGDWISLHTADPGTTGANEATGGSPAYARQQTTWTAGSADGDVPGSSVSLDVPAGTYTHAGQWSEEEGGSFIQGAELPDPIVAASQDQITLTPTDTEA